MQVPLLDLKAQYQTIRDEIQAAVLEVFETQYFIGGPNVTNCEEAIATYAGCAHGIGVTSGTDALLVSLMALGVGPGDEVITSPYTFFATAGSIARVGAKPVFVDIDPETFNLVPEQIEPAITERTKAIMPVHLYGRMASMNEIMSLARRHDLPVIEDAAQAIGARTGDAPAGSVGTVGCFSFFPSKNLGGAGDGGMVVTQDAELAKKIAVARAHGSEIKYYHASVGGNFRLDALQAAVVLVKLGHLDRWTRARQDNARRYDSLFKDAGLSPGPIATPTGLYDQPPGENHVVNQYVIRTPQRDALRAHLNEKGVGCEVYYPVPLHMQACFEELGYSEGAFAESERAARETLALPIYPELSAAQAQYVVQCISDFHTHKG